MRGYENWEHSTAYNFIRSAITKARKASKTETTTSIFTFRLHQGEKDSLEEMGYTLSYFGAGHVICIITWEK